MRWISLVVALAFLDASLTFQNVWPTPAIWWQGNLSIELAVCLLGLVIVARWFRPPSRGVFSGLALLWSVLALGRYAEVTVPALHGRDINLYWDLRFIPDVAAMTARAAPIWLVVSVVVALMVMVTLLYRSLRFAWLRVAAGLDNRSEQCALALLSGAAILFFAVQRTSSIAPEDSAFPAAVTATYVRQIHLATRAAAVVPPPSPPMLSDFSRVRGADVFLVFVESYGAVSFERPDIVEALAPSRSDLEAAIRETRREVVSAFVESPTFGGSSWLAHLSLISGVEVRDPETNARLMTEQRDTLVRAFSRGGFRTVALLPGMRKPWPEGAFYGFDEIYGADRLAYRGPQFGWFAIPDQFSLDRLDALELSRPGRLPLFVVFPTISTHFPFSPTPPYQPDWRRLSTDRPYDGPEIVRAYSRELDWVDFAPGYVEAIAYDYASIAGYLRRWHDRDFVLILVGDHQPPSMVSGPDASWNVPVHMIANRPAVLEAFIGSGFRHGLAPAAPAIGRMHTLLPAMLAAFGGREPDAMPVAQWIIPEGVTNGADRLHAQPVHRDHRVER